LKILWIPNHPGGPGFVGAGEHIIRHLKRNHEIYRIRWHTREQFSGPADLIDSLRFYRRKKNGLTDFHVRRVPDVTRPFRRNRLKSIWLNEYLFQKDLRRIVRENDVDVMVTAYTEYVTGRPPFDLDIPVIFHYLDCDDWEKHPQRPTEPYLRKSEGVVGVSHLAVERARQYNSSVRYITNGVDVEHFRNADGNQILKQYDLQDATVVTLLGLKVRAYYFLEAVLKAHEKRPDLRCVLVGKSETIRQKINALPGDKHPFIYLGAVPHSEVPNILAASDVGLYPVIHDDYNDGRSPIKVFEYTAANLPIVMPPVKETRHLNFDNFEFVDPDPPSMAAGILRAADRGPVEEPRVHNHDLAHLAGQWEEFLRNHAHTSGTAK